MAMSIHWDKCTPDGIWYTLNLLNLEHSIFNEMKGVYIIWNEDNIIRVGSGIIRDRLSAHRKDTEIITYGKLYATWAQVNDNQMEGIEKYLADRLQPIVGERFPDRTPIEVNLPWQQYINR